MSKTTDFTKVFQDMLAAFPIDSTAMQNAFKTQAAFGERLSKVALDAAQKSSDISNGWTKDTLARMSEISRAKNDAAEYAKALSDFASKSAEMAAENMAAFAEVAKKVQTETVELMLAAGKSASDDAAAAVKKASADVQTAARKAAASAA